MLLKTKLSLKLSLPSLKIRREAGESGFQRADQKAAVLFADDHASY
jgi:hypothetical protein